MVEKDSKLIELEKILEEFVPGTRFPVFTWSNSKSGMRASAHYLTAPNENSEYSKGKYFYSEDNALIHFTKLSSLKEIIKGVTLRLYNLKNMDDPLEYEYAGRLFPDKEDIKDAKENIFSASFCSESLLGKDRMNAQFNQWRLYGDNGKGACIVFSISNDSRKWVSHHMSKVYYGEHEDVGKTNVTFNSLRRKLEELNRTKPYVGFDFGKIFCFHKSPLYQDEEEVRLIYDARQMKRGNQNRTYSFKGEVNYPIIKGGSSNGEEGVKFLELSLDEKKIRDINDEEIPLLKIEKIILGYGFKLEEYLEQSKKIQEICKDNLGYVPELERTNLAIYYWGNQ